MKLEPNLRIDAGDIWQKKRDAAIGIKIDGINTTTGQVYYTFVPARPSFDKGAMDVGQLVREYRPS